MTKLWRKIFHVSVVSYFIALLLWKLSVHILGFHAKCQIYLNLNQSLGNLDEPSEVEKRNKEKGALLIDENECGY